MNAACELLEHLRRINVTVERCGGHLHLRDDGDVLTAQLVAQVTGARRQLLQILAPPVDPVTATVLLAGGMPDQMLTLGLETYFDRDFRLKRLAIGEYVHDPRFHGLGLSVRHPDGHHEFHVDIEWAIDDLRRMYGRELEDATVTCHDSYFMLYALKQRYGVHPRHFTDTMLLAHHVHGRSMASLAALGKRYGLDTGNDRSFMDGVRDPDPRQLADLQEDARKRVEVIHELAQHLLPQISRPEFELPLLQHTVRLFTERGIHVDRQTARDLRVQISADLKAALHQAGVTADQVSKDGSFATLLTRALTGTGRSVPMKTGKNGLILATAKTDEAMQQLTDDADPKVAALARARLKVKSCAQVDARLHTIDRIVAGTGGTVPVYLTYWGAHTGRFAGGDKLNLQNLGRSGDGARIRSLLTAAPGHQLIIADLAQIEARVIAWFARQQDMLEAFAQQRDLYSDFAAEVFNREVRKPRTQDPQELAQELTALRQIGKQAILGLGFAMGAMRFIERLQAEPLLAELFARGELSRKRCCQIVHAYRQRYPAIPCMWRELEQTVRSLAEEQWEETHQLRFKRTGQDLTVELPSGRALRYPDLRLDRTPQTIVHLNNEGEEEQFTSCEPRLVYGANQPLYGGLLTENIVQAAARDVLVEAMLDLEAQSIPTLFHVHDELVVQVPEDQADAALNCVRRRLEQPPAWAPDLPVACEAHIGSCYTA